MKKTLVVLLMLAITALSCRQGGPASALGKTDNTAEKQPPVYTLGPMPAPAPNNQGGGKLVTVDPKYRANKGTVVIPEKMFLAQTNDIYQNPGDYIGKTIKLEGIFKKEQSTTQAYYFVIRYGPGCCGSDGDAGLEVVWAKPESGTTEYPNNNDWVEAVGVLGMYTEDDRPYLCLSLSSLKTMETRGAEYVAQ